jgi:hypothetical protein
LTKAGTVTTKPVSHVAGFTCAAAVALLDAGHGVRHLEVHRQRQMNPDRVRVVELHGDFRLGQQIQRLVAERFPREMNLRTFRCS